MQPPLAALGTCVPTGAGATDQLTSYQSPSILAWEKISSHSYPDSIFCVWRNTQFQHRAGIKAPSEEQLTFLPCAHTSSEKSFSDKRLSA